MTPRDDHTPQWSTAIQLRALGIRIREYRTLARISQRELADRAGLGRSRSHVSAIESGVVNLSFNTLCALASALDLHPADLLDDRAPIADPHRSC
jgi:transcriptional regulator with XRE-family HTH domain